MTAPGDALASFAPLAAHLGRGARRRIAIPSLTGSADAFLAAALATSGGSPRLVLAVTPGLPDADRLSDDLRTISAAAPEPFRVLEFPPGFGDDRSARGTRLKTLAAIRGASQDPAVVVAAFPALSTPVPAEPADALALELKASAPVKHGELCAQLAAFGYRRVPAVEQEGDFSVRGCIVDAWSPGEEFPVRAEFFGDDLESLRTFDAATQRSVSRIDAASLLSAADEGESAADAAVSPRPTLVDFLPRDCAVLAIEHNEYSLSSPALARLSAADAAVFTGDPAPEGVPCDPFQTSPLPGFAELGAGEAHHPELFEAARARLDRHLAAAAARGAEVFRIDALSGGFEVAPSPEHPRGMIVVTKADRVFTRRRRRAAARADGTRGARLGDFDEIEPGELVVHVDYGVGRYAGSSEIQLDGRRSEVFTIEYADGAKLHVPAAHAHLLSRYVGVKGREPELHRLDGKRWSRDKAAAQKAVEDLAASLLETQARRELVHGFSYNTQCEGRDAFDAAFPYEETPDQTAAIAAVDRDLASRRPMDRLVCGDAGYGKTEVAMRAAYVAAMNGKQTAVLAPTTVLAEQHFETFTSRFDGTPVRIESVSRFQTKDTHEGTFRRLLSGACDIVIGTHAILSPKIAFHDLGLVIIDEEQRFGVRHKEFLKRLRATADVLTLSATPIPRTLYLSMTGARDLSLLRTPPRERVAVETSVVRDTDDAVRRAILSELERGGQVFFLHNRVKTIGRVEKRLKELVPGLKIVVAHGQMDARTLARKMRDFERGRYDVLLSTTIVESGIDIPRANTIFVDRADAFGLADLYQLRGRVGRSSVRGRAIFLIPAEGTLDSAARERLSALRRHGGLGAGFNLAVRDLELRGAGNLLGTQQSGHIAAVGFGLYCQLLRRTVAMMKGEKVREIVDVKLNLDFIDASPASSDDAASAALPYSYVEEDAQRMSFMKRLAEAFDEKAVRLVAEDLEDRFGPMPPAAARLVKIAGLRAKCAAAGICNVDVSGSRAVFYRSGERRPAFVRELKGGTPDRKLKELSQGLRG